jgi:Holliday junction DNA helicase RuvA
VIFKTIGIGNCWLLEENGMFEYIRGVLQDKNIGEAVVEAAGVGYSLTIPLSTYDKLPSVGAEVKILIHHHVREDAERLFGFLSRAERDLFRQIIGISNIGPKTALSVLSGVSTEALRECVMSSDASRLKKIPGIGEKTAQRLVMELKGKVDFLKGSADIPENGSKAVPSLSRIEAFHAMISLGYAEKQVQGALSRVECILGDNAGAEEWIKKALQVI